MPKANLELKTSGELLDEIMQLRGALATIHNSTESDAIRHRDYEHLASSVYAIAKAALDGEFVDDMRAAEVYDRLRASQVTNGHQGGET